MELFCYIIQQKYQLKITAVQNMLSYLIKKSRKHTSTRHVSKLIHSQDQSDTKNTNKNDKLLHNCTPNYDIDILQYI